MRVLIDSNVLISAALFPNSVPCLAYMKAAVYPYHGMICEQNVDEIKRIFNKKFPHKKAALDAFLSFQVHRGRRKQTVVFRCLLSSRNGHVKKSV